MPPDEHLDLVELRTVSAQEVADATGVPIETVWSAAKNGSLYGRKLGREWRFTIPAVRPSEYTVNSRGRKGKFRAVSASP